MKTLGSGTYRHIDEAKRGIEGRTTLGFFKVERSKIDIKNLRCKACIF
jgi:hypothetical protein